MKPPHITQSIFIAGGKIKKGRPVLTGQVGADQSAEIVGSSTDVSRALGESDSGKVVYYHTTAGNDANPGTAGSPKQTYGAAAALVDGVAKTWAEQQDGVDLDLSSEPTIVNVQASQGVQPELIAIGSLPSVTSFSDISDVGDLNHGAMGSGAGVLIVGRPDYFKRSTDGGATWVDVLNDSSIYFAFRGLGEVAFANGVFLIADGVNLWRSADLGLTWAKVVTDPTANGFDNVQGVHYGNGVWYAHGNGDVSDPQRVEISSDNGLTWSRVTLPASGGTTSLFFGATDGAGTSVMFSNLKLGASNIGYISTDDGANWSLVTYASLNFSGGATAERVTGLSYANSKFMAIGNEMASTNEETSTSSDGSTWALQAGLVPVAYSNFTLPPRRVRLEGAAGFWLLGGKQGTILTSSNDGTSWASVSAGALSIDVTGITYMLGKFFMCGNSAGNGKIVEGDQQQTPVEGLAGFDVNLETFLHNDSLVNCTFDGVTDWQSAAGASISNCAFTDCVILPDGNLSNSSIDAASVLAATLTVVAVWSNNTFGQVTILAGSLTINKSTFAPTTGKALEYTGATITVDECRLVSTDDDTATLNSDFAKVTNSLVIAENVNKSALIINGAAAAKPDISVEFVTCIGAMKFNNTGGTGLELCINSIVTGVIDALSTAADRMTINSGDFLGTISPNIITTSTVRRVDPLFLDAVDYLLQRQVPYVDGGQAFTFDSPVIKSAIDESGNGSTVGYLNSNALPRDLGCWNYDESLVKELFSDPEYFPRPGKQGVVFRRFNNSELLRAARRAVDIDHDPAGATEAVIITFNGLTKKYLNWIERQEKRVDQLVFLSLQPELRFNLPTFIVDGAQSKGALVITVDIQQAVIWQGAAFKIGSKEYVIKDALPNFAEATRLVLDRPLDDDLTDLQVLTPKFPKGLGEYKYLPPKQADWFREVIEDHDDELGQTGIEFFLIREVEQ